MFREGQQIGGYTLIDVLGSGGFGEVWLAERRTALVTKKVAIKLPHAGQVELETIRQEASLWEQASGHPNVLPIIDADIYNGQVVIVSEYASGGTLAQKLKDQGKLTIKQAVENTIGILNGLEFLHTKKIIHRDIKPANILLQENTPRLADFGISRAMNTEALSATIVGTDAYMSPESFDGVRNAQTDIWSVGVVLYQVLSGSLPFPQKHPTERMFAILTKDFPPLADEIPANLRDIVEKSLAKLPENRYRSAKEMLEDLQKALVNINHPTFAPTEILKKPLKFIEDDAPTIDSPAIKDRPIIPEKPAVEAPPPELEKTQESPTIKPLALMKDNSIINPFIRGFTDDNKPQSDTRTDFNLIPRTVASLDVPQSEVLNLNETSDPTDVKEKTHSETSSSPGILSSGTGHRVFCSQCLSSHLQQLRIIY